MRAIVPPTFPGLCRLAGQDRREFGRQATRLCTIQWACGLIIALAVWIVAPFVIPFLLKPEFNDSIKVMQITVWSLAPACLIIQLRYIYIALSKQTVFVRWSVFFVVFKSVVLIVLTRRYGIWGACYGVVLAELLFALLMRIGTALAAVSVRFVWRITLLTLATAIWVGVLWGLGDERALTPVLAAVYVLVAGYMVNRLLWKIREHMQIRTDRNGVSIDDTIDL